ncbi:hypothetical protein CONPUDRAFT_72292 [Coniophora puteana RWD-64-598 SS2]|uniref:DUF6532 domain-containing protein n=1 Tax=Coniophora puteana (strain RWD-64-598) TaxID=741705 RepID=A0A5M3MRZ7_CONPW|nr:uncharacterized protein CONPUDRAFT_72292 [Coniophora puteana RWD-64-598 SS2]EIW81932.1 hypothetical protein CONPUDRAFT_72292 [Coniophora puteana RWD-64-598 SS2]
MTLSPPIDMGNTDSPAASPFCNIVASRRPPFAVGRAGASRRYLRFESSLICRSEDELEGEPGSGFLVRLQSLDDKPLLMQGEVIRDVPGMRRDVIYSQVYEGLDFSGQVYDAGENIRLVANGIGQDNDLQEHEVHHIQSNPAKQRVAERGARQSQTSFTVDTILFLLPFTQAKGATRRVAGRPPKFARLAKGLPTISSGLKRRRSDLEDEGHRTEERGTGDSTRSVRPKAGTRQPSVLVIDSSDEDTESELTEIEDSCCASDVSEAENADDNDTELPIQVSELRTKELFPKQLATGDTGQGTTLAAAYSLKAQQEGVANTSEMQQFVKDSATLAAHNLIFGGDVCDWMSKVSEDGRLHRFQSPLARRGYGLNMVVFAAMVHIARGAGYDGQGDILDKLANGSMELFVYPLVIFGTTRLKSLCKGFMRAVQPKAYRLLNIQGKTRDELSALLKDSSYIYPHKDGKAGFLPRAFAFANPDMTKPFGSEVISEGIKAAFFTPHGESEVHYQVYQSFGLGLAYRHELTSSINERSDEHEVTPAMLLFASTAIAAVIKQKLNGSIRAPLSGAELDQLFKDHLLLLATFQKRKPVAYHRLMHGILEKCWCVPCGTTARNSKANAVRSFSGSSLGKSGHQPVGKKIVDDVDWDLIPDV